ncbi:MAG: hypothetical protein RIB93_24260 [Coleofasciculus sp. D1-CHI-01]|uniref:hypothetical protein n=1 Tax=Coleofasciculus sp. D1-CHI-01 TaxID=3068482 RepID=UPI0032FE5933
MGRCVKGFGYSYSPQSFYAVGLWYDKFDQTTDQEVRDLMERAASQQPARA